MKKKFLLAGLLALALVACGEKEKVEAAEQSTNTVAEETQTMAETDSKEAEMKEETANEKGAEMEVEILSYVNKDNEKKITASINSNDFFETAVLTYVLEDGEKNIIDMKRETSASGVIMKAADEKIKVEYLAKGDEATFIINDVEYKAQLVK